MPYLPTLLSQVLVAFTIEVDNAFEQRMPNFTSSGKTIPPGSVWLTSLAMWSNFLRYVPDEGVRVEDLAGAAGSIGGMERWGYIRVHRDPNGAPRPPATKGFGTSGGLKADSVIRPTDAGRRARDVWRSVLPEVESRWEARFDGLDHLHGALRVIADQFGIDVHYLPVVNGPLFTVADLPSQPEPATPLSASLSQVLLGFTLDYESSADVSLPIAANVVRVLGDDPVRVSDLPELAGIAKEAVSWSLTYLGKGGIVEVGPDPSGKRGKAVSLTPLGARAREAYHRRVAEIEDAWRERFGTGAVEGLKGALDALFAPGNGGRPRLAGGLEPHGGGWRARKPYRTQTDAMLADPASGLPHHPMVLHRGGFPDGS